MGTQTTVGEPYSHQERANATNSVVSLEASFVPMSGLFSFPPTSPLHINYGFWFYVFLWDSCKGVHQPRHEFLTFFIWFFFLFGCFVTLWCVYLLFTLFYYDSLDAHLFIKDRKSVDSDGKSGTGFIQNILYGKCIF